MAPRSIATLSLALALLASAACQSTSFPQHAPVDDPAARAALHERVLAARPPMKAVHRAYFVRGADQVALTMYSDFQAPDSMKLAAVSDLGVTVFQLESTADGVRVLHESTAFPASFLDNYLLPDLMAIWAVPPVEQCELVRVAPGNVDGSSVDGSQGDTALAYADGDSRVLAYATSGAGLQQYQRGRGGNVLSELELSSSRGAAAGDPPRHKLQITSAEGSYSANLVITPWTESGG